MEKALPSLNFDSLMTEHISRILLVCSSYDQFILEEDGRIEMQIQAEYAELSLTNPPRFIRAQDAQTALELLEASGDFDLVISLYNIGSLSPFEFSQQVKRARPDIPFVLLTSFSHEISQRLASEDTSHIDYVFSWQGNAELILAIIKMIEDGRNAQSDILDYGVQGILLVEDNVRFYSAYLPDLYKIVLTQTAATVAEALNEQQRTLRKRARPKVLFARTYDEAYALYDKYSQYLLGVICDVSFAKNSLKGEVIPLAGVRLCKQIRKRDSRLPLLLQSSEMMMKAKADDVGADFIFKHSKSLFVELERFIHQRLAFGAFEFKDPTTGEVLAVANDLATMQSAIECLPDDVLLHYSAQNMFSKWLYARGLFGVASDIRAQFADNFDSVSGLRAYLDQSIKGYRRAMGQGVIAEFNPATYNRFITFARCGSGSLGGKARGLAFVGNIIEQYNLYEQWDGVRITIPRTLAIATGYFEEFMRDNGLYAIASEMLDDGEILSEFVGARLPERLLADVRVFLAEVRRPIAVRSSSKLEDSHHQPFAGIYSTYMVPRIDNPDREVRLVSKAIKSVYASVFFSSSRAYIESTNNVIGEESMGVVIQEMCGSEQDGYFFPTISGVARSLNFYPIGDEKPEEGVCDIALGLGKVVVEGGARLRFSPSHPRHTLQLSTMESMLRDTQKYFYALDMNPARLKTSVNDAVNLSQIELSQASAFRNLRYVASTWDFQNDRINDHFNPDARHIITFAAILKYETFPLAQIIARLLEICLKEFKTPLEIEFAVNMDVAPGERAVFNLLQIRPTADASRCQSLDWNEVETADAIIYAQKALGRGAIPNISDIIYVRQENFDSMHTTLIAQQIEQLNALFKEQNKNYILIGPGRWGSVDSHLGIPVKWAQISQSKVIVESSLENFRVDPSQGTHFFQNLTSLGVGYVTLNPSIDDGVFDIKMLDNLPAQHETTYIRAVHFDQPLFVFVDGQASRAIIRPSSL